MAAKEIGERQLLAITVVVFAVVLLVISTFVVLSYRRYSKLENDRAALRREIGQYDLVIAEGAAVEKELEESKTKFQECKEYLPSDENVQQLLKAVSEMCLESALESVNVSRDVAGPGPALGAKPPYEAVRYRYEFRGSFHQLSRFVSRVENWKHFRRFASIKAFNLEAADRGMTRDSGKQRHKATLTLEVYRYNEPPKPAGAPGGAK